MRWFKEHKAISTVVIVLLVLVIAFTVSVITMGNGNTITEIVHSGINEVTGVLYNAEKNVRSTAKGIFAYKELESENEALIAQNNELKKELAQNAITMEQLEELRNLSQILNYNYTEAEFDMVSCDITSYDASSTVNTFNISAGEEQGIEAGDCVVNGMGLVGRIIETGNGWSKVSTVLDDGTGISFKIARDSKQLGVVSGNGEGGICGYMMNVDSTITEGDVIITSGLGIYPEGIEIGSVKSVDYNSNTLLKEISIEPCVNFNELEKVAVIR